MQLTLQQIPENHPGVMNNRCNVLRQTEKKKHYARNQQTTLPEPRSVFIALQNGDNEACGHTTPRRLFPGATEAGPKVSSISSCTGVMFFDADLAANHGLTTLCDRYPRCSTAAD